VNGFIAVNDNVLNVVWTVLENLKLTVQLQTINLTSRIPVSRG